MFDKDNSGSISGDEIQAILGGGKMEQDVID
jgi:hypothetical protein